MAGPTEHNQAARPVLIFGPPRSGTSLLSRLIDAHPNIAIPFESHLFNQWWPRRQAYGDLSKPRAQRQLLSDILRFGVVRDWSPAPDLDEVMALVRGPGFEGASRALMQWWARLQGACRWGEKTPHHLLLHETVLDVWSDATVVFILRDPRDAILSWKHARFGPRHVLPLSHAWLKYARAFEASWSSLGERSRILIRYEDLVRAPDGSLRRVMEHLGESYEAEQTEFYKDAGSFCTDARNASQLQQRVRPDSIGRYRKGLTRRELRIIESVIGDTMDRLGYARDLPDPEVSPVESVVSRYIEHPATRLVGAFQNRQGFGYLARDLGWETSKLRRSLLGTD